jgi:hypothetical protein
MSDNPVLYTCTFARSRMAPLASALLVLSYMFSLPTAPAVAQGLVYVDAQDDFGANPNLSPGDPLTYPNLSDVLNDSATVANDDKWGYRGSGVGATVYEAGGSPASTGPPATYETARELKQTISGLAAGSYDIYVAYWTNVNEDWSIAGGLTSGQQVVYNFQGPNAFFPTATAGSRAAAAAWTTSPGLFAEAGNRAMLLGYVGTTSAVGGEIEVFINDPPGQTSNGRRSWFDGVAYVPAGTEIFLEATINRTTGEIILENNTPVNYTVKSYSINSSFGSLDATQWDTIAGNPVIDPDPWTITAPANPASTPFATSLAEQENAGGSGGALLAANTGVLNFGSDVWISTPTEDVSISLTLADGSVISPLINYTGTAAMRGDLNGDGDITFDDYTILSTNMHTDVSAITFADAYLRGDMTGYRRINYEDFEEFVFAFDEANGGAGAFSRMLGVPEPASAALLLMGAVGFFGIRRRARLEAANSAEKGNVSRLLMKRSTPLIAALVAIALNADALAVGVTGWQMDTSFGRPNSPVLTGDTTSSPTLGNGTVDNARNTAIYASFPQVNLADGQQVTLTGSATLTGITPTRGTFRWGLLYENGSPAVDTFGWLGFLSENSNLEDTGNLNSKSPSGQAFATTTFASTVGTPPRAVALDSSRDRDFQEFVSGTYDFSMTIGRFGNEVYVDSALSSASGFSQKWRYATESDPARLTFNYNRVGILSGDVLAPDQVAFSNIDVSTSAIDTLTLQVTTSGPSAGSTKIVNSLGQAVNLNYYEISSATGGLSLSGWDSLDADANVVGPGWNVAGGASGLVLSESNLSGALLGNNAELTLGTAYDPLSAQNLRFFYGLTDGTFVRGLVEYVEGAGLEGDYNGDNIVNAADYVAWRKTPGAFGGDPGGYNTWRQNFGEAGPGAGGAQGVPEPTAIASVIVAMLGVGLMRRRG